LFLKCEYVIFAAEIYSFRLEEWFVRGGRFERRKDMMKKLLVLMFVLGLVTSANAALVYTVTFQSPGLPVCPGPPGHSPGGEFDVTPGQVVTIQIVANQVCTTSYAVSIMESTTSTHGYATANAVGALNGSFNFNLVPGTKENTMTNSGGTYTPRYILIDRISAGMSPAGAIASGTALYTFSITIPTAAVFCDTYTIGAAVPSSPYISPPVLSYSHKVDNVVVATNDPLVLHVIPEPVTIALLGLGGLFLRRRK
jgi:hypothetical protein